MNSTASSSVSKTSLSRRRFPRLRRVVLALAIIGTLTALFYAVEDWRGRAAWEKCKTEIEAKGLPLEWAKFIPSDTVADADNFFKAPMMQEWFVKKDPRNYTNQISWKMPNVSASNPVVVAEVKVILPGTAEATGKADGVFQLDDPDTAQKTEKMALEAIGQHVWGAQGFTFVARPTENIKPVQINLRADKMPATSDLAKLFPERALAPRDYIPRTTSGLKVRAAGGNSFQVVLDPAPEGAAAFIAATDKMQGDFDLLRAALKRPYARPEGNYAAPAAQPVPNYVMLRVSAQLFSERAQCHMMLGQPQEAFQDLTVLDGLCRMLEFRPSGRITLVGAMINVAVRGLYAQIVADGIRLGAWREPQFAALEEQLQRVNLPPIVRSGFRTAGAACCDHLEKFTATEYAGTFSSVGRGVELKSFWDYAKEGNFWIFALTPRGWCYQNMVRVARAHAIMDGEFDAPGGTVDPARANEAADYMSGLGGNPYSYFTTKFVPNYIRAGTVMGYQQTMANEALIACALERYHTAEGKYPESLDALAPKFLDKVPKDIIGGQPLVYHRTDDGKFMLYSIGWNQKDDGGVTSRNKTSGAMEQGSGDWVWLNCLE